MVKYNPKEWFGLIFQFHKADTFRKLFWVLISLMIFNAGIIYLVTRYYPGYLNNTPILHSLLGLVISLLLVFRTNTAYDRWWEGRKQWGALVNVSRNFAMKVKAFIPVNQPIRRKQLGSLAACYAGVLKEHLRHADRERIVKLLPANFRQGVSDHVPNHVALQMQMLILEMFRKRELSEASYLSMMQNLDQFTDICGACERIKKTPIPYTYNIFIKKIIFAYVITLPFAFAGLGYPSIGITVLVFYAFASLEMIAEEIEEPFGTDANDLPTDALAETIHKNVQAIMSSELDWQGESQKQGAS